MRRLLNAEGRRCSARGARESAAQFYVPNSDSDTVDVIDPRGSRWSSISRSARCPQHVTPSWNLQTLYVLNDEGNSVTPIDPRTAKPGARSLWTTPTTCTSRPTGATRSSSPSGLNRLDFRDAAHDPAAALAAVPAAAWTTWTSPPTALPARELRVLRAADQGRCRAQRSSARSRWPDGRDAAGRQALPRRPRLLCRRHDATASGWSTARTAHRRFHSDRPGAHGLYPSRDSQDAVRHESRRGIDLGDRFRTGRSSRKWKIPGGSPDMGGVSADGKVLWLSGRYDAEVYAISTGPAVCSPASRSAAGRTDCASGRSPGGYSLGPHRNPPLTGKTKATRKGRARVAFLRLAAEQREEAGRHRRFECSCG